MVEGLHLRGRSTTLIVAAGVGQGRLEGIVGHDEVPEPAHEAPRLGHGRALRLGRTGLERIARATAFAERFGEDLGHGYGDGIVLARVAAGATGDRV